MDHHSFDVRRKLSLAVDWNTARTILTTVTRFQWPSIATRPEQIDSYSTTHLRILLRHRQRRQLLPSTQKRSIQTSFWWMWYFVVKGLYYCGFQRSNRFLGVLFWVLFPSLCGETIVSHEPNICKNYSHLLSLSCGENSRLSHFERGEVLQHECKYRVCKTVDLFSLSFSSLHVSKF